MALDGPMPFKLFWLGQTALGAALTLDLCMVLALTLCFVMAFLDFAGAALMAGAATAAGAAAVWAAAGVEITAKGMARTATLARMDRNFSWGISGCW